MTMPPETSYKVDKLYDHEDFAAWKGDVYKIVRSSDPQLLDLIPNSINNTLDAQGKCCKEEARAKAMIVLNLGTIEKVRW